jgi:hypothetical protein
VEEELDEGALVGSEAGAEAGAGERGGAGVEVVADEGEGRSRGRLVAPGAEGGEEEVAGADAWVEDAQGGVGGALCGGDGACGHPVGHPGGGEDLGGDGELGGAELAAAGVDARDDAGAGVGLEPEEEPAGERFGGLSEGL